MRSLSSLTSSCVTVDLGDPDGDAQTTPRPIVAANMVDDKWPTSPCRDAVARSRNSQTAKAPASRRRSAAWKKWSTDKMAYVGHTVRGRDNPTRIRAGASKVADQPNRL